MISCLSPCSSHKKAYDGDILPNGKLYKFCERCSYLTRARKISLSPGKKEVSVSIYTSHEGDPRETFCLRKNPLLACPKSTINNLQVLSKTHNVYLSRVKTNDDFLKVLSTIIEGYGQVDHISLGGHGHKEALVLGEFILENTPEVQRKIFPKLRQALKNRGILFLDSCHTGTKDGLAQKMSEFIRDRLIIATDFTSGSSQNFYLADPKHIYTEICRWNVISFVVLSIFACLFKYNSFSIFESILLGIPITVLANLSKLFTSPVRKFFATIPPSILSMASGIQANYMNGVLQKC